MICRKCLLSLLLLLSLPAISQSGYVGDYVDLKISYSANELLGRPTWKKHSGPVGSVSLYPATEKASVHIDSYYTGNVRIKADYQLKNGQNKTQYFEVSCNAVSLNVSPTSITFNKVGDKQAIQYTTSPSGKRPQVDYKSSNKNVASVNLAGVVTAEGEGSATITISNSMGPESTINVTVGNGGNNGGGDNGGNNGGGDNGGNNEDDNKVIHDGDYFQYKTAEGYNMLFLAYYAYGQLCCMVTPSPAGLTAVSKSVEGKVTIPAYARNLKVCSLEDQSFYLVTGLNELVIPYTVFYVGNICQGCFYLSKVTCEATTPPTCSSKAFTSNTFKGTLYVPKGCVSKYKNAKVWRDFANIREIGSSPEKDISINEENFPDVNFRNYLMEKEYGKDKILTADEIEEIEVLDIKNKGLKNLKGIEHFYALEKLWCSDNQISEIDVSKNLRLTQLSCDWNDIKELDLSKNTSLNSLSCRYNQITKLDLSKNPKLEGLSCYHNPLTELDLTKNPALTSLDCSSTQLTELDLTKNPALSSLNCSYTQLTELDLTKNPALTSLNFSNTQLTELDLTKNPALTSLNFSNTQLTLKFLTRSFC